MTAFSVDCAEVDWASIYTHGFSMNKIHKQFTYQGATVDWRDREEEEITGSNMVHLGNQLF